jgi:hypothetical protein
MSGNAEATTANYLSRWWLEGKKCKHHHDAAVSLGFVPSNMNGAISVNAR